MRFDVEKETIQKFYDLCKNRFHKYRDLNDIAALFFLSFSIFDIVLLSVHVFNNSLTNLNI